MLGDREKSHFIYSAAFIMDFKIPSPRFAFPYQATIVGAYLHTRNKFFASLMLRIIMKKGR